MYICYFTYTCVHVHVCVCVCACVCACACESPCVRVRVSMCVCVRKCWWQYAYSVFPWSFSRLKECALCHVSLWSLTTYNYLHTTCDMYICRVWISHGVAGVSNCLFCFPPPSAVGKGTEVCPGPLAVHAAIQQEEVCLGTAGRSPRYVHVNTCVYSVRSTLRNVFSIHDACSWLDHCLLVISAYYINVYYTCVYIRVYNASSRMD